MLRSAQTGQSAPHPEPAGVLDDGNLAAARGPIRHLEIALENSRTIGTAVGIIMARKLLDRVAAFGVR